MLGVKLEETRVFREAREDQARSLILRQLTRKIGSINGATFDRFNLLKIDQLESLGEDLLDFESIADLNVWLETHG